MQIPTSATSVHMPPARHLLIHGFGNLITRTDALDGWAMVVVIVTDQVSRCRDGSAELNIHY